MNLACRAWRGVAWRVRRIVVEVTDLVSIKNVEGLPTTAADNPWPVISFLSLFYIKIESDEPMAGHPESQINRVLVVAPTCENENRPSMPSMRPSSQEAVACSPTTIDCCIPPGIYRCMPWVVDCCMLVVYMPLRP